MVPIDRKGMTENQCVQGYLAHWDEMIRRYPSVMIDSCASGGRRNDLESMRRSVPLHKTDADYSDFALIIQTSKRYRRPLRAVESLHDHHVR